MTTNDERDAYLLRGRRVLLSDLMKAQLLTPGNQLVFRRPRLGETYEAVVTTDGKILLEDGRAFASPSTAASAAAGGSLDGWHAWQIAPDGAFLDVLRQELLDQVARAERTRDASDGKTNEWLSHYEFLQEARRRADEGTPVILRVQDLLSYWNVSSRSQGVMDQVTADLENHGLTTEPSFTKTGIDSLVTVLHHSPAETVADEEPQDVATPESVDEVGLTLGNIPSANHGVETISPQATYDEAITRMLLNDYSQLAVMNGPRGTPRAVTWQSIAKARHANPDGSLTGAIIDAVTRPFDTELVDVLATLEEKDFVFVVDDAKQLSGIVTTADVVHAYGQMATPFFIMGELDQILRRTVADNFTIDAVRETCDPNNRRNIQSYNQMSMGDYQQLFGRPEHWETLGWPLDRKIFIQRLESLRAVRNDLVHFNPDPIPVQTVSQVRHMVQLVRRYAP